MNGVVLEKLNSTLLREGEQVLNYEQYLLHLISIFSNRVKAISSQQYLQRFGLGSVDMRVIASLAYRPNQKASEVCELISIDKGAASRAFRLLDEKRLILGDTSSGKQKRWSLSEAGWGLHRRFLDVVLTREEQLYQGLSDAELLSFHSTLTKLIANLSHLEQSLPRVKQFKE